jgi:quaternary ammonium compound-resistance protein SugE
VPCALQACAILLFGESREVARLVSIGLIVAGIVGLKLPTPDNN